MPDAVPIIETGRLVLRGPQGSDFPVYRDFFADAEASRFYGGPLAPDRAWRVLATDVGHWSLRGYGRWAIVEKASGTTVGGCGLWWPRRLSAFRTDVVDRACRPAQRVRA